MSQACIPLQYYVDFLDLLQRNRDIIEVITYNDLPWGDDFNCQDSYPEEWRRWNERMQTDPHARKKIFLLIQHDVDGAPHLTHQLLREEQKYSIPSNVMIFHRRIDRKALQDRAQVEFTDYPLDVDHLRTIEQSRFVIAYHSNAYEQAVFDPRKADEIFAADVSALQLRHQIRYFSAHGGVRDASGRSNSSLPVPALLANSLRWVHNGHSPKFHGDYSDGALLGGRRHPVQIDLRYFVRTWEPGRRYRVLTHPQYYDWSPRRSKALAAVPWYQDILATYPPAGESAASGECGNAWNGKTVPHGNRLSRALARRWWKACRAREFYAAQR